METHIAIAMVKAYAIIARIEGMKAENMQRQILSESMAYTACDFEAEANELDCLLRDM